jgi:hypothetical protein
MDGLLVFIEEQCRNALPLSLKTFPGPVGNYSSDEH